MSKADVLIIGGGISGLSLAWWLTQQGMCAEVWEADERIGGKIKSTQQDGYLTERAAAMVMNFRPEVSDFIRGTGLESAKTHRLPEAEARRYLLHNEQLTALPMRMGGMITSPLWSLRGKLRLLAEPFILPRYRKDESVSRFVTRRLGREMLEKAMEPFVAGTLAADPDLASAEACLPRLTALERKYGSITAGVLVNRLLRRRTACGTETFSFHGGMSTLIRTLAASPGITVRTGYRVTEFHREGKHWQVSASTDNGDIMRRIPQLVLTTPTDSSSRLLKPLNKELSQLLEGIQYAPVSVVHLGFDRQQVQHPLDGTGFLTPRQAQKVLTGNLWMSSLFSHRAPPGKVLLSAYMGGARSPQVLDWSDDQTLNAAQQQLQPLLGIKGSPDMLRIDRHDKALPLYHGAHQARSLQIKQCLQQFPGLYIEGNFVGGVSVRDRIAKAREVSRVIFQQQQKIAEKSVILPIQGLETNYQIP
jgi:oxygen-dependent protoporphyrinogen oxidase